VIRIFCRVLDFKGQQAIVKLFLAEGRWLKTQAEEWKKLQSGDLTDLLIKLVSPNIQIDAPVFFSTSSDLLASSISAINFGFTGVSYSPCAIPVTPLGEQFLNPAWSWCLAGCKKTTSCSALAESAVCTVYY
jgi:hypothetical protein